MFERRGGGPLAVDLRMQTNKNKKPDNCAVSTTRKADAKQCILPLHIIKLVVRTLVASTPSIPVVLKSFIIC